MDTLSCDNLQFDYSQVGGSKVNNIKNLLQITDLPNGLQVHNDGAEIFAEVFDLIGNKIFSKSERDLLSLDLSNFINGVYLVTISSGDHHEMRKIMVVH